MGADSGRSAVLDKDGHRSSGRRETVDFTGALFSGGTTRFGNARFSGGTVLFTGARFAGAEVGFNDARFSGAEVVFDLSEGTLDFTGAQFSGGEVDFSGAGGWSSPPAFSWGRTGTPARGVKLPKKEDQTGGQEQAPTGR